MEPSFQEDPARILVVDDEKVIREILCDFLTLEGMVVRTAENGAAAVAELEKRTYNLVISDLKMPQMGGLDLLQHINQRGINVLTVIMTGFGTVETAIEAMKMGAYDYVLKPFKVEEVVHIVKRGLERQRLQLENMRLKEALSLYKTSAAISQSLSLDHVLELVINAMIEELNADLVTLHLPTEPGQLEFVERMRRGRVVGDSESATDLGTDWISIEALLKYHEADRPVLANGIKTQRFFQQGMAGRRPVSFCSVPLMAQKRVLGILNAFSYTSGHKFSEGQRKMMAVLGARAAVSIENAKLYENLLRTNRHLEAANFSLEENFRQTIVGFVNALEESDRYTSGHSERVAVYSRLIGEGMRLSEPEVERIALSAKIHDIGKIGIPTEKLNKVSGLTRQETNDFRSHPEKGRRILEPIPFLRDLIPGAYAHHEKFDGSGYPRGLKGEDIPLLGRIISVADAYDAMTSDRAYRRALPHAAAVDELLSCAGTQFDPDVVDVFLRELERRRQRTPGIQTSFPAFAAVTGM